MKLLYASIAVIVFISIHACSSQAEKTQAVETMGPEATNNKTDTDKLLKSDKNTAIDQSSFVYPVQRAQQLSTPEVQIIRELYESGCTINEIELNRRQQQMRISCASDKPFNSNIN